ncbi:helix-turn-helix domain-containing protein [Micromonospora sp. U56]|uniref:helix-turn-helix domain-containing protein n=1 Tax=Micromonospora sp. U56 TaxID=2824900 RepID=UPI001B39732A|nr:helix-turn-helix transcriptional regulator [Micromonospora sp. U56]MBQ0897192.1 helix-turn-helix domain-containing protein [Micromonospora sp. U56]
MTATILNRPATGRAIVNPAVTFGPTVARLRRRRGLSQVVCAQLVGWSETWLAKVEHDRIPVDRLSVLRDLARVLGVDLAVLIEVAR